tara:strand:- start:93 stop:1334 length:1242 start_codon:yes stop_codon:yes gene_type:complete
MLIIEAPPQHGKSEAIIDVISWIAGRNPDLRTIYASFSERLGVRANLKLQRLYSKKVYSDIFSKTTINTKNVVTGANYLRNREILEYVNNDGYFRNTTVQGSITGESLDLGVIDDPIKGREAANSETTRNKTWEWLTDDFFTRFSEEAGFLMILTRWHIDDPAARLIENNPRIQVLKYRAIAVEDDANRKIGEALIPKHKSIEFLLERKVLMGGNFEALYQQSPTIKGGNLLQSDWIKWVDEETVDTINFDKKFITADTALKDKQKNDYTVYSLFGMYQNKLYWLDMYRGKPKSLQRELTAKEFYSKYDEYPFSGMYIEQKASGVDLFQRMKEARLMVFEIERNVDKIYRAETISPYIETHGLYINKSIPHKIDLISEYEAFPNAPHDDIIDTLLDGVEIGYKNKCIDYNDLL